MMQKNINNALLKFLWSQLHTNYWPKLYTVRYIKWYTHTVMMLLNIHGHRTQGQTHQIEGIEADLRQNDTVSSVGVVGGRFDVSVIKVLQIQWLMAVPVTEGDQSAHHGVFGWAADSCDRTHRFKVQQKTGVILKEGEEGSFKNNFNHFRTNNGGVVLENG